MWGALRGQFVLSKLYLARPAALKISGANLVTRAAVNCISLRSISSTPIVSYPTRSTSAAKKTTSSGTRSSGTKGGATAKKGVGRKAAAKPKKTVAAKKKAKPKKKVVKKKVVKPKQKPTIKITREMRKPKKPPTAFLLFSTKFTKASDQPKATLADHAVLARQASDVWNTLNAVEKQPFLDEAKALLPAYETKYAMWVEKMKETPAALTKLNQMRTRRGTTKLRLPRPPEGERRPLNSYLLYSQERIRAPEYYGVSVTERAKAISAEWRELSAQDKKRYEDLARANMEEFKRQHA